MSDYGMGRGRRKPLKANKRRANPRAGLLPNGKVPGGRKGLPPGLGGAPRGGMTGRLPSGTRSGNPVPNTLMGQLPSRQRGAESSNPVPNTLPGSRPGSTRDYTDSDPNTLMPRAAALRALRARYAGSGGRRGAVRQA